MDNSDTIIKMIKNAEIYSPEYLGKKDVLIASDTICCINDKIEIEKELELEVIDADGKKLVPGFIDTHVHIVGGGGEGGYKTRTPEIMLSNVIRGGITTIVGCLGTDGTTRTMSNLIAKARALEEEGITSFIYTGSYKVPVKTLTGSIEDDLILIDKIIGVGEIAIADHRSSQPDMEQIKKTAAAARVGGILSGKAGIVNVHLGDGNGGIKMIEQIVTNSEIPISQFLPTHVDRSPAVFDAAIKYAKNGGLIDMTSSGIREFSDGKITCGKLLKRALNKNVPIRNISFSSDGQGSMPDFDDKKMLVGLKVGDVKSLFREIRGSVVEEKIPIETALQVVTTNPARNLKLAAKGKIQVGMDADLLLLDEDFHIDTVIAKGKIMILGKQVLVKGTFE